MSFSDSFSTPWELGPLWAICKVPTKIAELKLKCYWRTALESQPKAFWRTTGPKANNLVFCFVLFCGGSSCKGSVQSTPLLAVTRHEFCGVNANSSIGIVTYCIVFNCILFCSWFDSEINIIYTNRFIGGWINPQFKGTLFCYCPWSSINKQNSRNLLPIPLTLWILLFDTLTL